MKCTTSCWTKQGQITFPRLEPLFFCPGSSHPCRLCCCCRSGSASAAALRTAPRSGSPDRSARPQSVRHSFERVTLEITAPIKAAALGPNAGDRHSSDTHGSTRRKLGLQQVAASGLTAAARPQNLPRAGGVHGVCAWFSESQSVPVPRSAATWSADLPIAGSSHLKLSNRALPVTFFKIKSPAIAAFRTPGVKQWNKTQNTLQKCTRIHRKVSHCFCPVLLTGIFSLLISLWAADAAEISGEFTEPMQEQTYSGGGRLALWIIYDARRH